METGLRAGVIALTLAGVAQTAGAQQEQVFRAELQPIGEATGGNALYADGQQALQRLKEQLSDPQQRLAMRAEQRISIEAGHPDLAAALGIDAATEQKFLELLADQQLERHVEFLERPRQAPAPGTQIMQAIAASQTKMMEAQRAVLGDEAMERYRDYMDTLGARLQVMRLGARLAARDKLQPDQKTRLMALIHEHDPLRSRDEPSKPPRMPGLMVHSESRGTPGPRFFVAFDHADRMEDLLKRTLEADRQLLASATGLLTAPQLTALEAMQGENVARLQQHVAQVRASTAASSALSAAREAQPAEEHVRKALPGDIRIEVSVAVDGGKPSVVKHTGPNGQAIELEVDGLVVEVTPTLYEGNWLETRTNYYEQGPKGRRHIGGGNQGGMVSQSLDGSLYGGGGSTVIMGSKKAYAVLTGVAAAAQ